MNRTDEKNGIEPWQSPTRWEVTVSRLTCVALALLTLIPFLYLLWHSLTGTTDMSTANRALECVTFLTENLAATLPMLLLTVLLCFLARIGLRRVPLPICKAFLLVYIVTVGCVWITSSRTMPGADSLVVTRAAYEASLGNFKELKSIYFHHFPFQLGYVFYSQVVLRLYDFGGNAMILQYLNIILLAFAEIGLVRFVDEVMMRRTAARLSCLLFLFCFQPILFSSFLYGNIPSLFFAVYALLYGGLFLKKEKWRHLLLSAVCVGIACSLKLNNVIVLVTLCALAFVKFIAKPHIKNAVYIGLAICMVLGLKSGAVRYYEKQTGEIYGSGIPMVSWLAMGTNEAFIAPGWYSYEYTVGNIVACGEDTEKATEISKAEVQKRLEVFKNDPAYARDFFSKKFLSQWNETTYQSLWVTQVRGHYTLPGQSGSTVENGGPLCVWVCGTDETGDVGTGTAAVKYFMDVYATLIFAGVVFALFALLRSWRVEKLALPLTVFGGMLYHLLFEAKSQYALVYFVLMVPLAAYGLDCLFTRYRRPRKSEAPETLEPDMEEI